MKILNDESVNQKAKAELNVAKFGEQCGGARTLVRVALLDLFGQLDACPFRRRTPEEQQQRGRS